MSLLRSNLGKIFYGCFGKGFWGPGTTRELIVRHGWLDAMFPLKLKFSWGDGIEAKGGLASGGLGSTTPSYWVSGMPKNVESPSGKSKRF